MRIVSGRISFFWLFMRSRVFSFSLSLSKRSLFLCSAGFPPSLELVPLVAFDNAEVDGADAFPDDFEAGVVYEVFFEAE